MQLHDMLDDGKAKASPAQFARSCAIHPVKAFGQPWYVRSGNSFARIDHCEFHPTLSVAIANRIIRGRRDCATTWRVLESVIKQVKHHLVNSVTVGKNRAQIL